MRVKLTLLLTVLIFFSCTDKKTDFVSELSKENLIQLELETLKIHLMVPQRHAIFENNNKVVIDVNPEARTVRQFSIIKFQPTNQKEQYTESYYFENGVILSYSVTEEAGGSGGIEYQLKGVLEFEEESFLISATDQKEFGDGNPEFCLKYLSTIRRITNNQ